VLKNPEYFERKEGFWDRITMRGKAKGQPEFLTTLNLNQTCAAIILCAHQEANG